MSAGRFSGSCENDWLPQLTNVPVVFSRVHVQVSQTLTVLDSEPITKAAFKKTTSSIEFPTIFQCLIPFTVNFVNINAKLLHIYVLRGLTIDLELDSIAESRFFTTLNNSLSPLKTNSKVSMSQLEMRWSNFSA